MMFEDFRTECREIIQDLWRLHMLRLFLLVTCVMAASTSTAESVAPCSVDTVPIQILPVNASLPPEYQAKYHSVITLSADMLSDRYFRSFMIDNPLFGAFMTSVTEHVATKLAKDKLCLTSPESGERSLLQFENLPLSIGGNTPRTLLPPLDAHSFSGCRISSPWIDFALEREPVPWVRGIVRWNARQLLADQAVLAGAKNVPPGAAMPLMHHEFRYFLGAYEDWNFFPRKPAAKPPEKLVPPDILWLFRHSWQSTKVPFGAEVSRAKDKTIEKSAESYTKLVIALIDRCFAFENADLHYSNILEVPDLIPLEQYKIDTLTR